MHNNQQLAFANTIESISHGASFADATMSGMGRGAKLLHGADAQLPEKP